MTTPTPLETTAFLVKLRKQADFLGDPALKAALEFIERFASGEAVQDNRAPDTKSELVVPPLRKSASAA
jgi:hypothetical protein